MRILNLQNAVLVSLTVAGVALGASLSACSSSDTPRPPADGGATGSTAGATGSTAGTGNTTAGGGDTSGTAGSGPTGGGETGTAGSAPTGGGAGGGSGGAGPASVCDGLGTKILDATAGFVDDFECVTAPCTAPKTVADGWSTFNDLGTPGADAADNTIKMLSIMPGAGGTAHAGQYMGTGANTTKTAPGFGVGAIFNVVIDPTAGIYCADISAFDGVSFWAKTGIAAGSNVNVNFVLPNTNAESKDPMTMKENGGDCVGNACYNHPKKLVAITSAWAQYHVTFAEATGGSAKVKSLIQELGFLSPDATWDFSLDEIAFYKGTPPAGAIAPAAP